MKIQLVTLVILINMLFYSCSAVSRLKSFSCRNDDYIYGRYKLSPWKTVEFRLYFKNHRPAASDGAIDVTHPKSVSCTWLFGHRQMLTRSCTNWSFRHHKTLKYRMQCSRKK